MHFGARNNLCGKIISIKRGDVMCQVKVELKGGDTMSSVMTVESLDDLGVKEGDTVRLVRFGDPNMENKSDDPKRRAAFRSRHSCDEKKSKLTPGYWSCKNW